MKNLSVSSSCRNRSPACTRYTYNLIHCTSPTYCSWCMLHQLTVFHTKGVSWKFPPLAPAINSKLCLLNYVYNSTSWSPARLASGSPPDISKPKIMIILAVLYVPRLIPSFGTFHTEMYTKSHAACNDGWEWCIQRAGQSKVTKIKPFLWYLCLQS